MAIKSETLETPERDMTLQNREPAAQSAAAAAARKREADAEELRLLRGRIYGLREAPPPDTKAHCRDCFLRGVGATLDAIES